ncbi:arginase family protein [Chryseobacterium sp. A301]
MNYQDFIVAPGEIRTKKWQLGSLFQNELVQGGIALLFVSDYRGAGRKAHARDFHFLRKELFQLSSHDFQVPMYDFGDLISGKSSEDTSYVLQEVLSACHYNKTIPIVIGGSTDLSFSLYSALDFHQKQISYSQISNYISLENEEDTINERNFLSRIFASKHFEIKNYHHLGYQRHLSQLDSVSLLKEVDFQEVRLAEMMNGMESIEPYLRSSDLVTLNCDAVESFSTPFSIHPQVNGLNRREVCALMKEVGLSQNLKSVGLFNLELDSQSELNLQLAAQMIWYLIEGINIQSSHPKNRSYETFWVLTPQGEYAFHRDTFSSLWYFGNASEMHSNLACSQKDYDLAKRGELSPRLVRFLNKLS